LLETDAGRRCWRRVPTRKLIEEHIIDQRQLLIERQALERRFRRREGQAGGALQRLDILDELGLVARGRFNDLASNPE